MSDIVNKDAGCHVHWDMDEFHKVADEAHDSEANGNRPTDVQVFWISKKHVRNKLRMYLRRSNLFVWASCTVSRTVDHVSSGRSFSFGVSKTDLVSITDELLGDLNEFLDLVRHVG